MDEADFEPSPAQDSTQATPVKSTNQARNPDSHVKGTPKPLAADSDDEGDDETIDVTAMKAFAKQVQQAPSSSFAKAPARVIIPKRGEKDFEPLNETQTIQEKMLRESRQALFDGLSGVRGTNSKHMSHALIDASISPYPLVKIARGNLFLSMGHSIRPTAAQVEAQIQLKTSIKGKERENVQSISVPALQSTTELLPEEALYLLERGTIQIWNKHGLSRPDVSNEFDEETQSFREATEMTVLEGFSTFIGREGLSLEHYQVYAGLKRLGYTVHRTPQFLPQRFRKQPPFATAVDRSNPRERMAPIWSIGSLLANKVQSLILSCGQMIRHVIATFTRVRYGRTLLGSCRGATSYNSLYAKLQVIPSGHTHPAEGPLKARSCEQVASQSIDTEDMYAPLKANPYLPFFHVWKPNAKWTSAKWDKASEEGLKTLPPQFWIGVVDARSVPFPSLPQMTEIFNMVPRVDAPLMRKRLPPASSNSTSSTQPSEGSSASSKSWLASVCNSLFSIKSSSVPEKPQINTFLSLKQGDRNMIVAVVDGGNVGWTRLGRGGFEEHSMVPPGW